MKQEPSQLQAAYKDILLSCTDKMAGLSLQETKKPPAEKGVFFQGSVTVSGEQPFEIRCVLERSVYNRIIKGMTNGKELGEEMERLYFAEYMNVVCGKIISRRNNERGEVLRISVPIVSGCTNKQQNSPMFQFTCEEGWMGVYFL